MDATPGPGELVPDVSNSVVADVIIIDDEEPMVSDLQA